MQWYKKQIIYTLLICICVLAGIYVAWDLSRIFSHLPAPEPQAEIMKGLRISVVVLCNFLIALIGPDGQGHRLATRLQMAFVLVLTADLLIAFDQFIAGMLVFLLVQLLLSARHLQGIVTAWQSGQLRRHLGFLVGSGVVLLGLLIALMLVVFWPHLGPQLLFFGLALYSLALGFSVWSALTCTVLGFFPRANAVLIAVAMACFAACDVCVAIDAAIPPSDPLFALSYFAWTFYTPALVLLVVSGYSLRYLAPWLPDEL